MAVFDPTMTAQRAAETLPTDALNASGHASDAPAYVQTKGYIDATRKSRRGPVAPPELDLMKEYKKRRVRIFNVGPWHHVIPCGSAGTFFIPPCPEDKPYVEMLTPLHELEEELYPSRDKKEYKRLQDEGRRMAIELLGEGRNQDMKQSRRHAGVFIAIGEVPTPEEVAEARKHLIPTCKQMCAYMDKLWDRDRKLAYDVFNPETFGKAARVLELTGKQKPWLNQDDPVDAFKCPSCRVVVERDAPICHNCKGVVNEEAWLALEARKQTLSATAEPVRRGPGRPPNSSREQ
jgi:hypothetical protein